MAGNRQFGTECPGEGGNSCVKRTRVLIIKFEKNPPEEVQNGPTLFSAECTIGMVLGVDVAKALWRYGTMGIRCKL